MTTQKATRRRRRRWLPAAAAAIAAAGALGATALSPAGAQEATSADGAQQAETARVTQTSGDGAVTLQEIWRDDFDGAPNSLPSADNWIIDTGTSYPGGPENWGTGEIQVYTDDPANVHVDGEGHLVITALKDGDTWTSSRIETQRTDFEAPEGGVLRIEASMMLPNVPGEQGLGYWPAFWTLGADYRGNYQNWPGIGEIDIMENVNGDNQIHNVLHCGVNPGGPCNETQGLGAATTCDDCGIAYHTYAVEIDRTGEVEELRWYLDDQLTHRLTSNDIDAQTWADTLHHGHFILLNLAMGGAFPNGVAGMDTPTDATVPGASLVVDYVAVSSS